MSALDLDLSAPLREALVAEDAISSRLGQYAGEPSVHTRRPAPSEAGSPWIITAGDIAITDQDALSSSRPLIRRDISIFGKKGAPGDSSDQTRTVEELGYLVRALFHRKPRSIIVPSHQVVSITAAGPFVGAVDDEGLVSRVVSLTVLLRAV